MEDEGDAILLNYIDDLSSVSPTPSSSKSETTKSEHTLSLANFDLEANLNIFSVLNENIIGKSIILKAEKHSKLEVKDQNNLAEIIISYFLNKGFKLNNIYLSLLADEITLAIPSEKRGTYYLSPIPEKRSRSNDPEVARGKLVVKHRNKLWSVRRTLNSWDNSTNPNEEKGIFIQSLLIH